MANPSVDKIKDLGLRHGEKVVVAGAAALSLWFLSEAFRGPDLSITPDQLRDTAARASKNVKRPVDRDELAKQMAGDFLKFPDLAKHVDAVANHQPLSIEGLQNLASLDPTGGVLRDRPELFAPYDLHAQGGRGGTLVYDRDEDGEFVWATDEPAESAKSTTRRSSRGRRANPARGGSMAMANPAGFPMAGGGKPEEPTEEEKKAEAKRLQRIKEGLVGKDTPADKDADKDSEESVDDGRRPKEVIKGLRWVAITGLFDNEKQRAAFAKALKIDLTSAYPGYEYLDLQRQELQPDGQWTEWATVDREANRKILEDVPEIDHERTLEDTRLKTLVDDLPFLKIGYWRGVHHASLLTEAEKLANKPKPPAAKGSAGMMMPGMPGMPGMSGSSSMMSGMPGMPGMGSMKPGMMSGSNSQMMGGSSMMGGMGSTVAEDNDFPKTEAPRVMVRGLDFTVVPEGIYRYRTRIVVRNPNREREDVNLGIDSTSKVLEGPWSEPTGTVSVPADVATYALAKSAPTAIGRGDEVDFQVSHWSDGDGQTVVKNFQAAPGQVIGNQDRVRVPDPKGVDKPTTKTVNFVSRYLLLDTAGGAHSVSQQLGLPPGPDLEVPALAVVLRPDGTVMIRNGAQDSRDPEPRDAKNDYTDSLKEADSNTKRKSAGSNSASPFGMMPGMPGAGGRGGRSSRGGRGR